MSGREVPFVADVDGLRRAVEDMSRCGTELGDLLDGTERSVAALHLSWDGEAAAAHRVAEQAWVAGFRDMHDALDAIRAVAGVAHDNYDGAAHTNVQMWERVG